MTRRRNIAEEAEGYWFKKLSAEGRLKRAQSKKAAFQGLKQDQIRGLELQSIRDPRFTFVITRTVTSDPAYSYEGKTYPWRYTTFSDGEPVGHGYQASIRDCVEYLVRDWGALKRISHANPNPPKGSYKMRCRACYAHAKSLPCQSCGNMICQVCASPAKGGCPLCRSFRASQERYDAETKALLAPKAPPPKPPRPKTHDERGVPYWAKGHDRPTYQESRTSASTPEEWRLPESLMVSDLGLRPVPFELDENDKLALPSGVKFFQVVDAHMGYRDAEVALLASPGFGATRSWHYRALGVVPSFFDGEGHVVQRWLRLFMRDPDKGPRGVLVPWMDSLGVPASQPGYDWRAHL